MSVDAADFNRLRGLNIPSGLSSLRDMFHRGKPTEAVARPAEKAGEVEGYPTDPNLLKHFFKYFRHLDVHAIATDTFLDKSRSEYNSAWLTRELVQNFVDHNSAHPGTLDGVRFSESRLPNGGRRFCIEGDWPFEDITGVISPHSEKPTDLNTAGGNGIGLKQTAIRFMRDFEVSRFEIQGEGWTVNYILAKAEEINKEWESVPGVVPLHNVKHDWLVAEIKETQARGKNSYIIETKNPEVIHALEQFLSLGVSLENPYLRKLDYQNSHGAIKWIPTPKDGDKDNPPRGRLFINGQVMNYGDKGTSAEDYWVGPQNATLVLNNVPYAISIDRPPVSDFMLSMHLGNLILAMPKEDIITQLQRSEAIWAGNLDVYSHFGRKNGALVVVKALADQLSYVNYDPKEYESLFPKRRYVYYDPALTPDQGYELVKKGYIICPSYLVALGMPPATSKIEVAAQEFKPPQVSLEAREAIAAEYGMEVGFEPFPSEDVPQLFSSISRRLADELNFVEPVQGRANAIRINLNRSVPRDLLFSPLRQPKTDTQQHLFTLRGIVVAGLRNGVFRNVVTAEEETVTTYALDRDRATNTEILFARNQKTATPRGSFIEIELSEDNCRVFQQTLIEVLEKKRLRAQQLSGQVAPSIDSVVTPKDETKITAVKPAGPSWTEEQEFLYQQARKKHGDDLTDADREIIRKKKELESGFRQVPIAQPEAPEGERDLKVLEKPAKLSANEQDRAAQMEADLPGIVQAVNALDLLVPETKPFDVTDQDPFAQYLAWRQSPDFYGQLGVGARYLTGRHLLEIFEEQNQADIAVAQATGETTPSTDTLITLQSKLRAIVGRIVPIEDQVDEFNLVTNPTETEMAQLGMLRMYLHLTTGVAIPNDLFLYEGTGSKGINLGTKAIGLHRSLCHTRFPETESTAIHETAHNEEMEHNVRFMHIMQSLFVVSEEKISAIATKLQAMQKLTDEEKVILDIRNRWNALVAPTN